MSRVGAAFGVGLATLFGVATAYATFQPEFEKQRVEREGPDADFKEQHTSNDQAISQAIASDMKEAKELIKGDGQKGFAWGIREAIWGTPETRAHDRDSGQQNKS